jgi:hypothetical protein
VDFEMVHAWRLQKMDICETSFDGPRTWTSPTSTRGHRQGPHADHAQSQHMVCAWTSRENIKISKKEKKKKVLFYNVCTCTISLMEIVSSSCFTLPRSCQDLNLGLLRGSPVYYQLHHGGNMKLDPLNH